MKTFGAILTIGSIGLLISSIIYGVTCNYRYEKEISSYWNLADKSSTITKKAEYIDKFVAAMEKQSFIGKYNAIFTKTADNSFDENFQALKTLQQRLHEISDMDVTSFQYQTAIQQITEQEQGEAYLMLNVFKGIYIKDNYFLLWNWVCGLQVILCLIGIIGGIAIWNVYQYD